MDICRLVKPLNEPSLRDVKKMTEKQNVNLVLFLEITKTLTPHEQCPETTLKSRRPFGRAA